jgi:hypothetical protein
MPALILLAASGVALTGCAGPSDEPQRHRGATGASHTAATTTSPSPPENIQVPPPPLTDGIFPCSECHRDITPNSERRKLIDAHDDIVLEHDEEHRWCLDCHNPDNRDKLRLASGALIDFSESYLLCGQCHGDKYRDWRAGVHGKRTGEWNGRKQYLLCVHCHNPHSPRFKPLKPMPPPNRPMPFGQSMGGES